MVNKILLMCLIGLMVLNITSATLCYQESTNVTTACGGLDTGKYSSGYSGNNAYYSAVYFKPNGALNNSYIELKYGQNADRLNYSIPQLCWDFSEINITFRVTSNSYDSNLEVECYSGSWTDIYTYSGSVRQTSSPSINGIISLYDGNWDTYACDAYDENMWVNGSECAGGNIDVAFYEEGMWWNITDGIKIDYPTNEINKGDTTQIELNWTNSRSDSDSCWYEYNGVNSSLLDCYTNTTNFDVTTNRTIRLWMNDTSDNNYSDTSTFDWYINLTILDQNGNLINNPNISIETTGNVYTENPLNRESEEFIANQTKRNLTIYITDLDGFATAVNTTIEFNTTQSHYSIIMNKSKLLTLNFNHYNGTKANATGYWSDTNETQNFTGDSITQALENLLQTITKFVFGKTQVVMDYKQFYEFQNDWITQTTENITILNDTSQQSYIKVIDEKNNPISSALVRVAFSLPTEGGEYKEMGQRFTDTNGETFFYFDPDSDVSIRVTKDNHNPLTWIGAIGEGNYTINNPLILRLEQGNVTVYKGVAIRVPHSFNNNDSTISLSIYAPSRNTISYTTNYRISQGYGNVNLQLDEFKRTGTDLQRGTDYATDTTSALTVYVYVDDILWSTVTVDYLGIDDSRFNEPSGLENEVKILLTWISLILLSGIIGLFVKGTDEGFGEGKIGKHLFFTGIIILNVLFWGSFTFLLIIAMFYYLSKYMRKIISE